MQPRTCRTSEHPELRVVYEYLDLPLSRLDPLVGKDVMARCSSASDGLARATCCGWSRSWPTADQGAWYPACPISCTSTRSWPRFDGHPHPCRPARPHDAATRIGTARLHPDRRGTARSRTWPARRCAASKSAEKRFDLYCTGSNAEMLSADMRHAAGRPRRRSAGTSVKVLPGVPRSSIGSKRAMSRLRRYMRYRRPGPPPEMDLVS